MPFITAALAGCALLARGADPLTHSFKPVRLSDKFWAEGASFGDLNRDGANDIIAGPYWYQGPDFKTRHEIYPAATTFKRKQPDGTETAVEGFEGALGTANKYSDNFFIWVRDFNQDGWNDVLMVGFPGKETAWFENPKEAARHWTKHVVFEPTDNESPTFTDLTGDGKPELVCNSRGYFGYATPDWSDLRKPWTFNPISPNNKYGQFTHGLGVGDVNGDGRLDVLEKNGWWEQPASLALNPVWTFHKQAFGTGGAQMFAYDVNGDGRNDVITALAAHGFGMAWFENVDDGADGISFVQHTFMNATPADNRYGVVFSELHALELVDMDGDGLRDIVTGKRYWSHGRMGAPDRDAPAVTYWFRLQRGPGKTVEWVPQLMDDNTGVGTQVVVGDVNGDGQPDVVVSNKKGTTVLLHETKRVSASGVDQPRLLQAP